MGDVARIANQGRYIPVIIALVGAKVLGSFFALRRVRPERGVLRNGGEALNNQVPEVRQIVASPTYLSFRQRNPK
jgi:hypothetical protein